MDFTSIDFETANFHRASPCALGMVKVKDGQIVDEASWLIKPPRQYRYFKPFNVGVHGITREMVETSPEWFEIYEEVSQFIGSDEIVAHNASFDMGVLRATCHEQNVTPIATQFLCTLQIARRAMRLPSYRLPFVAGELGVPLEHHHDALEDARAAALVALRLGERSGAQSLGDLAAHHHVRLGRVDHDAYSPAGQHSRGLLHAEVNGAADPDGYLYGKTVVFTGALLSMTRQSAWDLTASVGGTPGKSTTKQTNILVMGSINEASLRPGAEMTSKAQKAFALQAAGQEIEVMTEADFLALVDSSQVTV